MQSFVRGGQPRLAYRVETPQGAPVGRVLMVHGYAEHSARYDHVVPLWLERGLVVARFDLRGHGRSDGPQGHVDAFEDYVRDVRDLLRHLEGDPSFRHPRPPVLFGHSLGGLIASFAAAELGSGVAGLALTSPFFGIAKPPPKLQAALGRLVAKVAPGLRQPSGLSGQDMTHDQARVQAYDADPLGFHHVTVGWFVAVTAAQERASERASRIHVPFFCIAGGDDRVVSLPATRRFVDALGSPDRELDVRPGLFHEVLNEPDYRDHAGRLGDHMVSWSRA
ncbi:MAG TPA: lysophospholipase [Polyangiaceae bacterium]|nr:lysophospholipase [Polyangiaceae bacterium]